MHGAGLKLIPAAVGTFIGSSELWSRSLINLAYSEFSGEWDVLQKRAGASRARRRSVTTRPTAWAGRS